MTGVRKTVLLDRDGVIIVDPPDERVTSLEEIELFEDTVSALKLLADRGFDAVIITNQAGIEEGRITEKDFWQIHSEVLRRIAPSGITILKTFMNGEMSKPDASPWRKPGPNILLDAASEFNLDLSDIFMVGDNQSDIDAANSAGCRGGVLVRTGNHFVNVHNETHIAQSLTDAVTFITSQYR